MKRASFKAVVTKCVWEEAFFRALLRDSKRALARARISMSANDQRKLERLLKNKKAMQDFKIYAKLLKKYGSKPQGILW